MINDGIAFGVGGLLICILVLVIYKYIIPKLNEVRALNDISLKSNTKYSDTYSTGFVNDFFSALDRLLRGIKRLFRARSFISFIPSLLGFIVVIMVGNLLLQQTQVAISEQTNISGAPLASSLSGLGIFPLLLSIIMITIGGIFLMGFFKSSTY
jgi:hypothetical protein